MSESYKPNPEEISAAEQMMDSDQAEQTVLREKFIVQDRDPFDGFMEQIDNRIVERRMPTPEELKQLDSRLVELGRIFENSGVRWNLDGALNISLRRGSYIGVHKDVDISVEKDDLEELNDVLSKKGYGLFLSSRKDELDPNSRRTMQRASARQFSKSDSEHLIIAAIDSQGKINDFSNLNYIDVHLSDRNEKGRPIGVNGVELPEQWFKTFVVGFHGREILLSHPARVAYYKLHGNREYDLTDIRFMVEGGQLSKSDIDKIEGLLRQELVGQEEDVKQIISEVIINLRLEMDKYEIFEKFAEHPRIKRAFEEVREPLFHLCEKIESSDRTLGKITSLTFEQFNVGEELSLRLKKLDLVRSWINNAEQS